MPLAFGRDKTLPDIPIDVDVLGTVERNGVNPPSHSARSDTCSDKNKMLPSIDIEKTLSGEEMDRLHDLWNGAALSARAHRKRQRSKNTTFLRVPPPISVPDPKDIPSPLPSATPSITTRSATATQKRWGFLSARKLSDAASEKKVTNGLEILRLRAQQRLMTKLKCTKSTPNLSGQLKVAVQASATGAPAVVRAAPIPGEAASAPVPSSPEELPASEMVPELETLDNNAIYFTIDPDWRASQENVLFKSITPVPSDRDLYDRPDSPLLHRHHSLDQFAFACQRSMSIAPGEERSTNTYPRPNDEFHSFLEF
ncbi:hypothetical protein PAXRUDRAFT_147857 [Paxillus rubicundulus Ve08.2h10]|uniref:Uncharacterized protein n=1 Tax=Paxillus rubicundulus Ve08.2h10 TaxID=930991 RepID=A0A0D0DZ59_9AGAM|nr:hypothetical protein PAXRUDRAFT_147857 [Paxillus rubicundulus Ve08.2h10]